MHSMSIAALDHSFLGALADPLATHIRNRFVAAIADEVKDVVAGHPDQALLNEDLRRPSNRWVPPFGN